MRSSRVPLLLLPLLLALTSLSRAEEQVTIRILDQHGLPIPGSKLVVDGVGTFDTGQIAPLPQGSRTAWIFPGLGGGSQLTHLYRQHTISITSGQTELDLEWITATVSIHLRDQHGIDIPGSLVAVEGSAGGYQAAPVSMVLPITDPAIYPTIGGAHAEGSNKGYDIQIVPGILGQSTGATTLLRIPGSRAANESVAVHASTTELDFRWTTQNVTFRLQDQFGVDIPASGIILYAAYGLGIQSLPLTVTLPITDVSVYPDMSGSESEHPGHGHGYGINLLPGILGELAGGHLQREEGISSTTAIQLHASTTTLQFEWITTELTIDLRDQNGTPILGSEITFSGAPTSGIHGLPFICTLPISDRSTYPTMMGPGSEGADKGYDIALIPGIHGVSQRTLTGGAANWYFLSRWAGQNPQIDEPVQVHAGQSTLNFEWITTELTVDLRDQFGATIQGSRVRIAQVSSSPQPVPFQITLPISDNLVYPSINGSAAEGSSRGYDILLHPGLGGQSQFPCCGDLLYRYPGTETNPTSEVVQVHAGQESLIYEWRTVDCAIQVTDAEGVPLPGSVLDLPMPFLQLSAGSLASMPVTDNGIYPNIQGAYANGYPIRVVPQDIAPTSGVFEFEISSSGAFSPALFTIGDRAYSLACGRNRPPIADAGPNLSIASIALSSTSILGTATDPDENTLTYRWLAGSTVLFGPATVSPSGGAPFALAGQSLGLGSHILTLEVSDGQLTSVSSMTLTLDNSPPDATCGGGGTFESGVDSVTLTAVVADFDGDMLTWSWSEGSTILANGTQPTSAGGAPVALPQVVLTTGIGGELSLGIHTLSLTISDGVHEPRTCTVTANVIDTIAPVLSPTSDCGILWPPNHQMVNVFIQANARDPQGGPVWITASVSSSEDPDKDGDGHTIPDWTDPYVDQSTGRIYLQVRRERSGKGPGRTYTISIRATDVAGNSTVATVTCLAPHDRRS